MKVSFVIPTHNNAEFLHPAVDSVLNQSYRDVECVIVDDCSTDSTGDYLAWLAKKDDPRVRIIRNDKNLGRSASRNIGNRSASGEILAVLDADDVAAPRRAELTVAKFKAGAQFVYGQAHFMDALARDLGFVPTDVFDLEKALSVLSAGIVHSTVAYSRELADKYPYIEGEPCRLGVDDFTVFIQMALDGVKFDFIPAPLCAYRRNDFGITAERDNDKVAAFKRGFVDALRVPA